MGINKLQKLKQSQIEEIEGKSELEELDSDFTCEICIEPVEANNKFKNNGMCKHNFCTDCIAKYVEAKVVEFNMAIVVCPALNCTFPLDPLSCRPILPKNLFDQWCELLCGETLLQKYGLRKRCYCPYPNCLALVLNECYDEPTKSTCPNCKNNFCFQCQSPWHAGYRCSEKHIERSPNDVLFGELIEQNKWTRCHKCGHAVQRICGCSRIHCRCGNTFCHDCGETISSSRRCKCSLSALEASCAMFFLLLIVFAFLGLPIILVFN